MSKKISVSFKETSKDMELLSVIMAMEDKSGDIKEILRKVLIQGYKLVPSKDSL